GQLPEDWEHFEPVMEKALNRLPALEHTGIQLFFNGPESFTPDDRYVLGEAPNLKHFFVAAGFNSVGIQSAGGAGMVLAEWIVNGLPPMDISDVDIRRMQPFQSNRRYLHDRTVEGLGLLYAMHWPFRQYETARDVRRSPLHDRLAARGACFGEAAGWERPNWYAPDGVEPTYAYSYGRQNWFAYAAEEHRAVREGVGLFDQTSFAKFLLQGRDVEAVLNRVCANNVAVPVGKIVYTPWLNPRGGIEADLTVTRIAPEQFLIVTSVASQTRDFHWLKTHIPEDAHAFLTDVTSAYSVLGVMGPASRQLLSKLTPADLSNAAFPFGTSQDIEMGYAWVRASRITYVGELGWELYIPTEYTVPIYDRLIDAGAAFGLKHCGYHAMNSLRLEKGYRHWGHDITDEDTPLEAGLGFTVAWDKPGGFIGREALLKQKEAGPLRKRLVGFVLDDPEPLLYHDEPIYRDGVMVGCTTSAMFGHTVGRSVCLGYIHSDTGVTASGLKHSRFDIDVAGQRFSAQPSLRAFVDPKHERVRGDHPSLAPR
ncbi:GcvT family protein, partial [Candidatus Entotheonella palauensis]|uniref:GcvT family protein n=1 Tax=Candidatus Entotheonella palauensis TaxID=93172 RepID=UPI001177CC4E